MLTVTQFWSVSMTIVPIVSDDGKGRSKPNLPWFVRTADVRHFAWSFAQRNGSIESCVIGPQHSHQLAIERSGR